MLANTVQTAPVNYADVFMTLPAGVLIIDKEGLVSQSNEQANRLLDMIPTGLSWGAVIDQVVDKTVPLANEVTLKNGKKLSVSTKALKGFGQLVLLQDVTANYVWQQKKQQEDKLVVLGKMSATLAHQIRTPLSAALLLCGELKSLRNRKHKEQVEQIIECLKAIDTQVHQHLSFTRGGTTPVQRLSVNDLLDAVKNRTQNIIKKQKGNLTIKPIKEEVVIIGHEESLLGVFDNLINNALEASNEPTDIAIISDINKNTCFITVKDNGPGIKQSDLTQLFQPFYTTKSQGTGLGLCIVKTIMSSHHGDVAIESNTTGTEVTLEFNRVQHG